MPSDVYPFVDDEFFAQVQDMLPEDFRLHDEIGKGSNNKVFRATWDGQIVTFRVPRRKSDTQEVGNAKWEHLHTKQASVLGVSPRLLKSWYSRHSKDGWPSGLYMVMECYEHDLDELLNDPEARPKMLDMKEAIGECLVSKLNCLAQNQLLVFDLKPSNIVLNIKGTLDVRIIDYGRDFCEWNPSKREQEQDRNTPILDMISRLTKGDSEMQKHLAFGTMLLQLASTTTRHIYDDRRRHRMGRSERRSINPTAHPAQIFWDSMQGTHKKLLRNVLRCDPIRGVLKHYHGRRNGGTRRTLLFAQARVC